MAGVILIVMGALKLGSHERHRVIIFVGQLKEFFGLPLAKMPAHTPHQVAAVALGALALATSPSPSASAWQWPQCCSCGEWKRSATSSWPHRKANSASAAAARRHRVNA